MKKFFWLLFFGVHLIWAQDVQSPENIQSLGFGSCNRTDLDPKIWETIAGEALDAWVWLGDIVYTDEESMQDLAQKYALQKSLPAYQKLIGKASVFGVWDERKLRDVVDSGPGGFRGTHAYVGPGGRHRVDGRAGLRESRARGDDRAF